MAFQESTPGHLMTTLGPLMMTPGHLMMEDDDYPWKGKQGRQAFNLNPAADEQDLWRRAVGMRDDTTADQFEGTLHDFGSKSLF